MISTAIRTFTPDEFVALVEKTGNFFEYSAGQIVWRQASEAVPIELIEAVLAGEINEQQFPIEKIMASLIHEKIISNLHGKLYLLLKDSPFVVYSQGTYLAVQSQNAQYRIPDLVVAPEAEERNERNYLLNPMVLIEVQSDSTVRKDRTEKLKEYTQIATLQDYLLIAQHDILIEQYSRQDAKKWTYESYDQMQDEIELRGLNIRFSLREVYEKIVFGN